ncbi:hypothetical protein HDK77DRAFT_161217 [Phyllosticta capitalensis]|uniref:Uncharacterized protein n=1 Tax=Phyllosticta capitalensis TaxID=121624 RepID=A0ABR1YTD4_9PEZI
MSSRHVRGPNTLGRGGAVKKWRGLCLREREKRTLSTFGPPSTMSCRKAPPQRGLWPGGERGAVEPWLVQEGRQSQHHNHLLPSFEQLQRRPSALMYPCHTKGDVAIHVVTGSLLRDEEYTSFDNSSLARLQDIYQNIWQAKPIIEFMRQDIHHGRTSGTPGLTSCKRPAVGALEPTNNTELRYERGFERPNSAASVLHSVSFCSCYAPCYAHCHAAVRRLFANHLCWTAGGLFPEGTNINGIDLCRPRAWTGT